MLQRHIEILYRLRLFGKHVEKCVADVRRIGVHHAHPFDAVYVTELTKQTREGVLFAEIFTVTRRILGDENEFFDTFFSELMSFSDDRTEATAAKVTTHLRNEAESTRTIAPFGNLHERVVRRRCEHAWGRFVVEVSRALISDGHYRK